MNRPWRREAGQVATIARATFSGFLESDLMPTGMQAPAMIWVAAFLVAPSLCLTGGEAKSDLYLGTDSHGYSGSAVTLSGI